MSNAAASEPTPGGATRPRRSITEILESIQTNRREQGLPELSEDEAMDIAVQETRAVRRELNERGLL